jgi:hypothetical protein
MAKSKRTPIIEAVKDTAVVTAGAFAGTKITDALQTTLEKSGNVNAHKIAPLGATALGLIGQMFAPPMLKKVFLGMTVVSGAEVIEKSMTPTPVIPTTTTTATTTETEPVQGVRVPAYNVDGVRVPAYTQNGYRSRY